MLFPFDADPFSNFGSLKSTETYRDLEEAASEFHFSNFGSLKSTETDPRPSSPAPQAAHISAISAR